MTTVARFTVDYTRFLDPSGKAVAELPAFARDPGRLVALYRAMVLTRAFDARAVALQRTGRLGTYASTLGQEAIGAALGEAMAPEDVLVPSYRETGAQIARGVKMSELLLYWGGDERGSCFTGPREDFPISVPVASQSCHAVGVAMAFRLRDEPRVAVSVCGDGATSKGDFYESLNAAGVWRLPLVFLVNNNQWAISVPRSRQSAAETIAQKAIAAGFRGEQVDGNDAVALRAVLDEAIGRARKGGGPTLVEALTYRLCDHTTADDASRYRPAEEVSSHWAEDPVVRLRNHLVAAGAWRKAEEEALLDECARAVEAAVAEYEYLPPQDPASLFDYLYAELPAALREQRESLVRGGGGDE